MSRWCTGRQTAVDLRMLNTLTKTSKSFTYNRRMKLSVRANACELSDDFCDVEYCDLSINMFSNDCLLLPIIVKP